MSPGSSEDSSIETLVKAEPKKLGDSTPASPLVKVEKESIGHRASALRTTALHLLLPTIYLPAPSLIQSDRKPLCWSQEDIITIMLRKT